jgi:hypothetical protein
VLPFRHSLNCSSAITLMFHLPLFLCLRNYLITVSCTHHDGDVSNTCKAEFRKAMTAAIPPLIELLKSKNFGVSSSVVSLLAKLSDYSELHPYDCEVANEHSKLNIKIQSGLLSHRSLNCSNTTNTSDMKVNIRLFLCLPNWLGTVCCCPIRLRRS